MKIDHVRKKHFRSLYRTFDAIARERRYFVRTSAPSRQAYKKIVWDAINRDLPFFVALDEKTVVGWANICFPTVPSLAHSGTLAMGVLEDYRRQGIGARLLERAISHAFEDPKRCRIQLEVFRDNESAIALYKKRFGFQIEGTAKQAILLEGDYKDIVHMALLTRGG